MPVRFLPSEAGGPRSEILTLPCKKRCLMAARSVAICRAASDTTPRSQGPPPRLPPAELTAWPPRLGAMMLRRRSDDADRNAAGAVAISRESAEAEGLLLASGFCFMSARKRRMFLGRAPPLPLPEGMETPSSSSCGHEAAAESCCCCGPGCRSGHATLGCGADCGLDSPSLRCGDGCGLNTPARSEAP